MAPVFPPLLRGVPSPAGVDPMAAAVADAAANGDPGRIHYALSGDALHAAVVLIPEVPLADAMGAMLAVQLGLNDALGALAPPEVAVHLRWPGRLSVNGGACGRFRAVASTTDPEAEPDWLVVGLEVTILPPPEHEPGLSPDETSLFGEGCGEVVALELLETWSRHMLVWLHRFLTDGIAPLREAWRGKCAEIDTDVITPEPGRFLGLDERAGMILRRPDGATAIFSLTSMLEPR
ncbi:MAG: BirA family biotin operon repressor/biotin-[acetyl-CoA-carboxylase] ligase [Paracoccaceae bacterium]|jgi:BirA family biotin operon repressor/biotin-[acetyl-CoA-carboxylase] ligase